MGVQSPHIRQNGTAPGALTPSHNPGKRRIFLSSQTKLVQLFCFTYVQFSFLSIIHFIEYFQVRATAATALPQPSVAIPIAARVLQPTLGG